MPLAHTLCSPLPLKLSASALLMRQAGNGADVFVLRRAAGRHFMPGFWAFATGHLADVDAAFARRWGHRAPFANDLHLAACALRELFEETGLLLVGPHPAQTIGDPGWQAVRRAMSERPEALAEALEERGLAPRWDLMSAAGTWDTPSWVEPAYHTAFFAVDVDALGPLAHQAAWCEALAGHLDLAEHDAGMWVPAREALERWQAGHWCMTAPVRRIITCLAHGLGPGTGEGGGADQPRRALLAPDEARDHAELRLCQGLAMLGLRTETLPPATHTNCYFVGESAFVVVDPGPVDVAEQASLWRAIEVRLALGHKLQAVLLTHHHTDHTGAVAETCRRYGAGLWAHAATGSRLGAPFALTREIRDREVIELGENHALVAYHTPGHAMGHLALWHTPSGCLLGGDLVATRGTIVVDPAEGGMGRYLQSLAMVRDLAPRMLLPAHGHPVADVAGLLQHYLSHRQERERRVLEALREFGGPAEAGELLPLAYADVPPNVWPLASLSLCAHLEHLVEQGLALVRGNRYAAS